MKRDENEYFGQITVAFISSRIQETKAKFLSAAEARVECGRVNGYWDRGYVVIGGQVGMQFQTECNAFYIGETRRSLSDRMNGHQFTTTVSNPDLPVAIHA